jgi:hypothetical protein
MTSTETPDLAATYDAPNQRGPLPALVLSGVASLGAGAIHAAAIGAHSDQQSVVITFTLLATFQLAWGAAAVAVRQPRPWLLAIGVIGSGAAVVGWFATKTVGIGVIAGFESTEGVQLADGAAAALALLAGVLAARALVSHGLAARPKGDRLLPVLVVPVVALTFASMLAVGSHSHAGGHAHGDEFADGHSHESTAPALTAPFVAGVDVDLSGVPGVSAQQQVEAEAVVERTLDRLPQFEDISTLNAKGFYSIGDASTGSEHYINWANVNDDKVLDPDYPESLVISHDRGREKLVAAMFMLPEGSTLDDVPDIGGALVQWHVHSDLCLTDDPVAPRLAFSDLFVGTAGECTPPNSKRGNTPMVHVWIVDNPCGPFAALDGIGGGQVADGEEHQCTEEHAHVEGS